MMQDSLSIDVESHSSSSLVLDCGIVSVKPKRIKLSQSQSQSINPSSSPSTLLGKMTPHSLGLMRGRAAQRRFCNQGHNANKHLRPLANRKMQQVHTQALCTKQQPAKLTTNINAAAVLSSGRLGKRHLRSTQRKANIAACKKRIQSIRLTVSLPFSKLAAI
jgi:hypothetical protein